jgi:hypothetical protein
VHTTYSLLEVNLCCIHSDRCFCEATCGPLVLGMQLLEADPAGDICFQMERSTFQVVNKTEKSIVDDANIQKAHSLVH